MFPIPLEPLLPNRLGLPAMNEIIDGLRIHSPQKRDPLRRRCASLSHERLAQRMVAVNEKFVSRVESLQVFECGDMCGFAVFAAVAVLTG